MARNNTLAGWMLWAPAGPFVRLSFRFFAAVLREPDDCFNFIIWNYISQPNTCKANSPSIVYFRIALGVLLRP